MNSPNLNIVKGNQIDTFKNASFGLKNRLARALWKTVWLLLARLSPAPLFAWRNLILRTFGARLGNHVHIYPNADIWAPWNLICGDNVGIANRCVIYNQAIIMLGSRVVISQGAHLCTGTHDYESQNFQLLAKPITISDHVWVAAETFIGPGVNLEEGAVVAARAVVTKTVPAWIIVGGNPAKKLKDRLKPSMWH